jgi:iron-sulfur cluster assembly accessory protein
VKGFLAQDTTLKARRSACSCRAAACSGFQYGFTFSEKEQGDEVTKVGEFDVVIDPRSLPYLDGVHVDWVESLQGSGFTVKNPNASGSCGCSSATLLGLSPGPTA